MYLEITHYSKTFYDNLCTDMVSLWCEFFFFKSRGDTSVQNISDNAHTDMASLWSGGALIYEIDIARPSVFAPIG